VTGDPRPGGRSWVEHLRPEECWRLLGSSPVGRVGVQVDSAPEIYPVNHVVDHESVVFRTAPGTKLHGLVRSPSVCFEVDGIDPDTHTGWSVLVKGRAIVLRRPVALRQVAHLPLDPWTDSDKPDWVRITPDEVTGRRIWHGITTATVPSPDPRHP
jgi:nitroimidazol reductase NimA-like FMN-containing flavoprotein (pyridoxamine 5'-phosphate oxidase superfamily)